MLPIALIFARRLTQPIRRLARAVQSLEIDDSEIAIPPGGPAELRLIATALSEMHDRLRSNARERAAMIAAIAHDLRTPLARIAFRVEASGDPLRTSVLHDIDQIRDMVGATVAYLRGDKNIGERSEIDLSKVAVSVATSAVEMGLPISLGRLERTLIVGNRLALERLIQNLIENSIKYAGAGEISVLRVADRVELRVIDNGPGIPDHDMARMFEPFERREPSRSRATGGVGLGLAIARSIANAHQGSLKAGNRPSGGLEMVLAFPATRDNHRQSAPPVASTAASDSGA